MRQCSILAFLLLGGCAAWSGHFQAEEEAADVLAVATAKLEAGRREGLVDPRAIGSDDDGFDEPEIPEDLPKTLTLQDALRIATTYNRQFLRERESLEIVALSLLGTRDLFQPRFSSDLAYSLNDRTGGQVIQDGSATFGVTQILPTGGDFSATARTGATKDEDRLPSRFRVTSSLDFRISQPLLRGAGSLQRFESLTQAERSLVYAVRDFELFRQDFTIRITGAFFGLVSRRQVMENNRLNLEQNRFLRARSEMFFDVGRMSGVDKFRAEQEFLQAEDRFLESEENYKLELDRFMIDLGLPTSVDIDVIGEPSNVMAVGLTLRPAIAAALANRLDVMTSNERVADARRGVKIARNDLLPDFDIVLTHRSTWRENTSFANQEFDRSDYGMGFSLTLPFERVSERNAYRRSLIELARSERAASLTEDNVVLDVRDALRRLSRIEASVTIQKKALLSDEKRYRISQIRLQEGKIGNRDVVEAQNSMLDTRNRIIELKVDHEVARLRLRRTLGTLFLDENGVPLE